MPGDETWAALETAALRVAPNMNSQAVTNTVYPHGTMERMPGTRGQDVDGAGDRGGVDGAEHELAGHGESDLGVRKTLYVVQR
mmetsp:Transcript_35439/g.88657  ORF Transcript_35439/g.88657 Transcript_35439/m.88657 type:complete len:83 (+) Transcript_35439:1133-1381(+)